MVRWLERFTGSNVQLHYDARIALALFFVAVFLYLPGIAWGLPEADAPGKTQGWAADEIGPLGPLVQLQNVVSRKQTGFLQYPLFHYLLLDIFYAPYLLFQWLTGGLVRPQGGYPFGFRDPVAGVQTLLLIARAVSVMMAAGTVVVAHFVAKTLWNATAGVIAAIFVMLMYPMFYYARTSNVDAASLFWVSLVLLLFARTLRDGRLPARSAAWMGLFAALAVATKEQNYALLLFLPLALMAISGRAPAAKADTSLWHRCKAPVLGLFVFVLVYLLASGVVLLPRMFAAHLDFIRYGGRFFYEYPATFAGYLGLGQETLRHLVETLSWPVLLAGCWGALLSLTRDRGKLWLLLPFPGLVLGALVPIRAVELRYMMVWGFLLACFAGYAVAEALRSSRRRWRGLALLVLASGCALTLLRATDLTYLLIRGGSRVEAAEWLAGHSQSGDRVEYFGVKDKLVFLPRLKTGVTWLHSSVGPLPGQGEMQGEFTLTIGRADQVSHRECPAWVYAGLRDGSLGYRLAVTIQTPTLFPHLFGVNPRIEIYARRDIAQQRSLAPLLAP